MLADPSAAQPLSLTRTAAHQASSAGNLPALDGLRAAAVALVFLSHYVPALLPGVPGIERLFPGMFGVTLFFVISGFLISTLLRREFLAAGTIGLKNFYVRRLLRLTPALYVYVAVVAAAYIVVDGAIVARDFLAALTYTANYYEAWHPSERNLYFMPVWSLAVEEHFYLLFPALMLLCMRRSMKALTAAVLVGIVASLAWRLVLARDAAVSWEAIYWRTDTRLDSLLFGVLLTCLSSARPDALSARSGAVLGVALLACSVVIRDEYFRNTLRYSLQGCALMLIVGHLVKGTSGIASAVRRASRTAPVLYLSKISYSLYLWHLTVLMFARHLLGAMTPATALLCAAASLGLAAASYRCVETPFLAMRHRFGSHADR